MADLSSLSRIVDQLRRLHEGDAWHGPSLREALDGVTAPLALRKSIPNAHSIYELTHHVTAWANEVTKRLEGRQPQMPDEGDFPEPVTTLSDGEWAEARARLDSAHAMLVEAILTFNPDRLHETVGDTRDAPLGVGVSYYNMLHGLIQHDAYHAGQIVMLKRAQT
ncbi:MAG: DinB family protein [Gemmatimonadaceae bacterium]